MNYFIGMKEKYAKSVFGGKLIELRLSKGLTQPELAERLGVSRDTIAYYETKAKNPTSEFIQKAADFFDVPYDQLLSPEIKPRKKPGPVSKIEKQLESIRKLPPQKQKTVSEMLDMVLSH